MEADDKEELILDYLFFGGALLSILTLGVWVVMEFGIWHAFLDIMLEFGTWVS